jgi:hypothetical protein
MEKRTLYYGHYAFPDLSVVVSYVMLCGILFSCCYLCVKIMGRVAVAV